MTPPGLVYYPDCEPGIRRRRCGRGFTYIAPDETTIDCKDERKRLAAMAVPPAYEDVWMSPLKNGHLWATGRDARARKQYRYHPDWSATRSEKKFEKLAEFGETLPALRRRIARGLSAEPGSFEAALAAVLALIDRASMRVGDPTYTRANGTYGATTLRRGHVRFQGRDAVQLRWRAKGGAKVAKRLRGAALHRALQRAADLPGAEIACWRDETGAVRPIRSEHVRAALAEVCGEAATAKTLRTWNGTHVAFLTLMDEDAPSLKRIAEATAARLHNTPAVARSSYIHPRIIELAQDEGRAETLARLKPIEADGLRRGEGALIALLAS